MDGMVSIERASRKTGDGMYEDGYLFTFDDVWRNGLLKVTKEYSLWHWPQSGSWTGDVIDASGWHDLSHEECIELVARKGLPGI